MTKYVSYTFAVITFIATILINCSACKSLELVAADVDNIEEAIKTCGRSEKKKAVLREFLGPILSLSHSRLDSFHGYRLLGERAIRPIPGLLYPRLTWPHLAEPREDGYYHIPLLLTKEAFRRCIKPEADLVFLLEPRLESKNAQKVRVESVYRPETVQFEFKDGSTGKYPDLHPELIPVLLVVEHSSVQQNLLYDLRILPRTRANEHAKASGRLTHALEAGDWIAAAEALPSIDAAELHAAGKAVARSRHPLFNDIMCEIACGLHRMASKHCAKTDLRLACRMRELATARFCDAPVWFDKGEESSPFHFVVAGDLQLHENAEAASRFFALLESGPTCCCGDLDARLGKQALGRLRATMTDGEIKQFLDGLGREKIHNISKAKFAVLVGDCVDGAASQAPVSYALNFGLGIPGPESPYADGGELELFTTMLRNCRKPVFAVPGNHDGGVGYPGVLNWPLDGLGWLLHFVWDDGAYFIRQCNEWVPGLIRPTLCGLVPSHYEGLEEWQYACGPTNLIFQFRGWQFLCINSFNLDPVHRATAGGVALNTGGGLQDEDVAWADVMFHCFKRSAPSNGAGQIVLMHHDPRGAQPLNGRSREERFGIYETIDTPVAVATFGYFGLFSYGTRNGVYIPLISPGFEYLYRILVGVRGPLAREWMRRCYWDDSAYGARDAIRVFNNHLASTENPKGIRAFFFAHDNAALQGKWLRDTESRLLFRSQEEPPWERTPFSDAIHSILHLFITIDDAKPPAWARKLVVPSDKNAKVIRLDDVSDTYHDGKHGFSLVECGGKDNVFDARHITLPTTQDP